MSREVPRLAELLALALVACLGEGSGQPAGMAKADDKVEVVRLGLLLPPSAIGKTIAGAASLAIERINNSSALLPGVRLEYEWSDSGCSAATAISQLSAMLNSMPYRTLDITSGNRDEAACRWQCSCSSAEKGCYSQDKCVEYRWLETTRQCKLYEGAGDVKLHALIGPACDEECEATAYLSAGRELVQISYACGSPLLSDDKKFPTFVRTVSSCLTHGRAIGALLQSYGWGDCVLLHSTEIRYTL